LLQGAIKGVVPLHPRYRKKHGQTLIHRRIELHRKLAKNLPAPSLFLTISDKGYVCSAQLVQGFDKEADQRALEATRKWRFNPSTKDGHPVMVEMRVEVGFWRNANGELIFNVAEKTKK
jgi:TonB family protein